jgi:hypothetical protein
MREIIDGGPHLADLTEKHLAACTGRRGRRWRATWRRASSVERPRPRDRQRRGVTLFYFLIVPMLRLIWDRDPLDPEVVAERPDGSRPAAWHGLAGPAAPKETTP